MSDNQVEEVKQKTDIVSVIGEHINLKKAGSNYKASCPFHSEKTASFMVSPELQIFKCFGCGEGGDVFSFLQKYEAMDFYEALKILSDKAGVKLVSKGRKQGSDRDKYYQINLLATRFYHFLLLKHKSGKDALNYLINSRGLTLSTIIEFQIGFAPKNRTALSDYLINRKNVQRKDIETLGLGYFQRGGFSDRFRERIIFPLKDHRGNVCGFSGRLVKDSDRLAKYINTRETPIYQKSKHLYGLDVARSDIKKLNKAIVVEGEFDLLSPWQAGFANIVAIKGSALTVDQTSLLGRYCKEVILALDADLAGEKATIKGISVLENAGFEVRVASFKKYKDPDEAVRTDRKIFEKALENALGAWDFVINRIFLNYKKGDGIAKSNISKEVVPVLANIQDSIVRSHYASKVAKKLNVPVESVFSQISKISRKSDFSKESTEFDKEDFEKPNRREIMERRLLAIAFKLDHKKLINEELVSLIKSPLFRRIIKHYFAFLKSKKKFTSESFSKSLPEELVGGFSDLILLEYSKLSTTTALRNEFDLLKTRLTKEALKEKMTTMASKIKKLEKKKNTKALKKAEKDFSDLTVKLTALESQKSNTV